MVLYNFERDLYNSSLKSQSETVLNLKTTNCSNSSTLLLKAYTPALIIVHHRIKRLIRQNALFPSMKIYYFNISIPGFGLRIVQIPKKHLSMILKTYTPTPHKYKFNSEQKRKFDILMYILLTLVALAVSIYTSL